MSVVLTKKKDANHPLCISDDYVSKCGRFEVEKKFGFGGYIWWLLSDNTRKLSYHISNCDSLREARENIKDIMDEKKD